MLSYPVNIINSECQHEQQQWVRVTTTKDERKHVSGMSLYRNEKDWANQGLMIFQSDVVNIRKRLVDVSKGGH